MESQTKRKGVVTLNDADELDAIIEESRKISALPKITDASVRALRPSLVGNGSPWQLILERART